MLLEKTHHVKYVAAAALLVLLWSEMGAAKVSAGAPAKAKSGTASGKLMVTVLEQQGTISGKQTIYVAPNAVRIDNKQRSLIIVSQAPAWKIEIYSPSARRFYETALPNFRGMMSQVFLYYGIDMSAFEFKLIKKAAFDGHDCLVYKPIPKAGSSDDDVRTSEACTGFWVADKLDVGRQGADLIAKQVCLPQTHRVPLRMDYKTDGHSTSHGLDTTRWSTTTVPADWFTVPDGYKKVTREAELYMANGKSAF